MADATSTSQFIVRPAAFSDASQLAVLATQLGYPSAADQVVARLRDISKHPEHAIFVAEGKTHEIAGYVEVFPFRTIGAEVRLEIGGLVVVESLRSHGVGRLLMEHAENWARANGYSEVGLRSNVIRERAHQFYENLGYVVNKTQKSFRKKL